MFCKKLEIAQKLMIVHWTLKEFVVFSPDIIVLSRNMQGAQNCQPRDLYGSVATHAQVPPKICGPMASMCRKALQSNVRKFAKYSKIAVPDVLLYTMFERGAPTNSQVTFLNNLPLQQMRGEAGKVSG